jgi:hypothetical protein
MTDDETTDNDDDDDKKKKRRSPPNAFSLFMQGRQTSFWMDDKKGNSEQIMVLMVLILASTF